MGREKKREGKSSAQPITTPADRRMITYYENRAQTRPQVARRVAPFIPADSRRHDATLTDALSFQDCRQEKILVKNASAYP